MQPDDGRIVSNLITQALAGAPLTIYGSGEQTRSFCFVDDLVEGFVRLMNADADIDGPINIGNPNETTVNELAEQILAMAGSSSRIVYHPLPVDDPRRRKPDISRALARLNWSPQVPLHDGLSRTIAYFMDEMRNSGRSPTSAFAS
jgi:UDP-glucuronate decarboxylase